MDNVLLVVEFLGRYEGPFTMLHLSKRINIPYATLYRTIKKHEDLFITKKVGSSTTIQLRWSELTVAYLTIASTKKRETFLKTVVIKHIAEQSKDITLLFGSYAKNKQKKDSDIDILVVGRKPSYRNLELLFKKEINPMVFTKEEAELMLNEEENVATQARKEHVILTGAHEFWSIVRKAHEARDYLRVQSAVQE